MATSSSICEQSVHETVASSSSTSAPNAHESSDSISPGASQHLACSATTGQCSDLSSMDDVARVVRIIENLKEKNYSFTEIRETLKKRFSESVIAEAVKRLPPDFDFDGHCEIVIRRTRLELKDLLFRVYRINRAKARSVLAELKRSPPSKIRLDELVVQMRALVPYVDDYDCNTKKATKRSWEECYNECKEFCEREGKLPPREGIVGHLGSWIHNQRNRSDKLQDAKLRKIDDLTRRFGPPSVEDVWHARFDELELYCVLHGSFPPKEGATEAVAKWFIRQRKALDRIGQEKALLVSGLLQRYKTNYEAVVVPHADLCARPHCSIDDLIKDNPEVSAMCRLLGLPFAAPLNQSYKYCTVGTGERLDGLRAIESWMFDKTQPRDAEIYSQIPEGLVHDALMAIGFSESVVDRFLRLQPRYQFITRFGHSCRLYIACRKCGLIMNRRSGINVWKSGLERAQKCEHEISYYQCCHPHSNDCPWAAANYFCEGGAAVLALGLPTRCYNQSCEAEDVYLSKACAKEFVLDVRSQYLYPESWKKYVSLAYSRGAGDPCAEFTLRKTDELGYTTCDTMTQDIVSVRFGSFEEDQHKRFSSPEELAELLRFTGQWQWLAFLADERITTARFDYFSESPCTIAIAQKQHGNTCGDKYGDVKRAYKALFRDLGIEIPDLTVRGPRLRPVKQAGRPWLLQRYAFVGEWEATCEDTLYFVDVSWSGGVIHRAPYAENFKIEGLSAFVIRLSHGRWELDVAQVAQSGVPDKLVWVSESGLVSTWIRKTLPYPFPG